MRARDGARGRGTARLWGAVVVPGKQPTGPVLVVPMPAASREVTNADLAAEMVSLRSQFHTHAELDRSELAQIRATLSHQPTTNVLGVIVAICTALAGLFTYLASR